MGNVIVTPGVATVIIIGAGNYGGRWAAGDDLAAAKRGFRQEGGVLGKGYAIVTFAPEVDDIDVDAFGGVAWHGPEPEVVRVPAK